MNETNDQNSKKINKKYIWATGALVVLIALGLAVKMFYPPFNGGNKSGYFFWGGKDEAIAPGPDAPIPEATPTPAQNPPAKKLSYGEAIKKYPYRIQFSQCHGNPGTVSLKVNVTLMLDNRDNKAHTMKVAGKSYYVAAYDYVLSYISKEGTYNLTCDGGGAATVNIEK